jgi:hypothetical protein
MAFIERIERVVNHSVAPLTTSVSMMIARPQLPAKLWNLIISQCSGLPMKPNQPKSVVQCMPVP